MIRRRTRTRAALRLASASFRLVPWWHLGVGAVIAAVAVWLRWRDPSHTVPAAVQGLRLAMFPLALSAAFVLDDPTQRMLAACPVPISLRRTLRVAAVLPVLAALWAALLTFAAAAPAFASTTERAGAAPEAAGFRLPVVALSLEFAGLVAVTLAAAALAERATDGDTGGVAAAPATLAVALALWLLPRRHGFFVAHAPAPAPGAPVGPGWVLWVDAHWRWALLAAISSAALAWAGRDLGRRRFLALISTRTARADERRTAGEPAVEAPDPEPAFCLLSGVSVNRRPRSTRQAPDEPLKERLP